MMRAWRAGVITAVITAAVAAQPAHADCTLGKFLELPVTMSGLRPMVEAEINGHKTRFIADSGAFYSTISPGTAAEFGLKLEAAPPGFRLVGIGGAAPRLSVAKVKDFGVGGVGLHDVQFLVGGSETGGAGLLGQNVLGIADVEYDLAGGAIRLMRPHDCPKVNFAYWAGPTTAVSMLPIESAQESRLHTMGTVLLNGVKIRAAFDTGASTSVLTLAAAARAGVKTDSLGVTRAGYSGGLGTKVVQNWIGPFASLQIGDETINKIRLRFGDVSDGGFDMLIGADFFLSHHVYVANSTHKMYFTYTGGPVFNLTTASPQDLTKTQGPSRMTGTAEPTTADGFAQRGEVLATRRDYPAALADLSRAVEMAPAEPRYRQQRAVVLLRTGQVGMAKVDLDRAIEQDASNVDALMLRATVRFRSRDRAGARADLDQAAKAAAKAADVRLAMGSIYSSLDAFELAIDQYALWIAAHPDDNRMAEALNGRCWARTLSGRDLPAAIDDCSRALKLRPKTAAYLDSRGLARLRSGDADRALTDFDAALAINPKLAWSLYGRGLVEMRQGRKAQGDADIAAAKAIRTDLPAAATKYGIGPAT